ncbi:MAG: ester cyclase [Chloroflexi bacterium]|nr:ester cyclase [Chloroflexota bacterium]
MTDRETNIATIKRAIEAVNQRDFGSLRETIRPEFQRHDLYGGLPEVSGQSGAVDLIQLLLQAMPDLHIELKQLFATDERAAAHFTVTGTHQGELFDVPGSGKRVQFNGINLYRLIDGKLAETWQLADVWGLMRQVGAA